MIGKRYANRLEQRALELGLLPRNIDERTIADRQWLESLRPAKPQSPCDIGLFSDEKDQLDLVNTIEMFME